MKNAFLLLLALTLASCNLGEPYSESHEMGDHTQLHGLPNMDNYTYADSVNEGIITEDTLRGSPRRVTSSQIGENQISIMYGSPGVRGRVIWGGLVAYDEVWVTGAHMATKVEFSKDIQIEDVIIPAGTYGFFTIPSRDSWTLILNSNWDQHLSDEYSMELDIVRYVVTPEITETMIPRLTYRIIEHELENQASIVMNWESIQVELPFSNVE
jgi:Protein of unknown function (DUF2911).